MPIDNAEIFAAKLELTEQPLVSWQAYRLQAGETLPQVAAKYSMSVETLRAVNGIGARSHVPVGHMLLVPSQRPSAEAAQSLSQAVFTTVPAGRTFYYTVRRGDTLARIASRYGVTVQETQRLERHCEGQGRGGPETARHERRRTGRQGRREDEARGGDEGRGQAEDSVQSGA